MTTTAWLALGWLGLPVALGVDLQEPAGLQCVGSEVEARVRVVSDKDVLFEDTQVVAAHCATGMHPSRVETLHQGLLGRCLLSGLLLARCEDLAHGVTADVVDAVGGASPVGLGLQRRVGSSGALLQVLYSDGGEARLPTALGDDGAFTTRPVYLRRHSPPVKGQRCVQWTRLDADGFVESVDAIELEHRRSQVERCRVPQGDLLVEVQLAATHWLVDDVLTPDPIATR